MAAKANGLGENVESDAVPLGNGTKCSPVVPVLTRKAQRKKITDKEEVKKESESSCEKSIKRSREHHASDVLIAEDYAHDENHKCSPESEVKPLESAIKDLFL